MAGVHVEGGQSKGRRTVDSEVNLIPMIDLFICCISFLLITAVWSQMASVKVNAEVPGQPPDPVPRVVDPPEKALTVEVRGEDKFVLLWKSGTTVHATKEVPRKAVEVDGPGGTTRRYPDLAREIAREWEANGSHKNNDDPAFDRAIVSVDNQTPFSDVVAVIDAIYATKRLRKGDQANAFAVAFASR